MAPAGLMNLMKFNGKKYIDHSKERTPHHNLMNLDNTVDFYRAAGNTQFKSGAGSNTVHSMDALPGSMTTFGDLMNLDTKTTTNSRTHNGDTVDGSYFKMGNVDVMDGGVQMMSDVGKNRVDIDKMSANQGSTTVFMAPAGLQNLNERIANAVRIY
jgi:hypothetical protein|tara:strand:+ start:250 stop:717 length:468 start_codon:yes stop_codon:yes gene_type:complete